MAVVVVPGMAQQEEGPILRPKPKPAAATLLVICDLACNWKLDGEARGRIDAGGSAKVKVEFGQHLVVAATEDGLDKAEEELNIKAAGLTLARLALVPVREARLKAELDARAKAKPAGATLLVICDLACDWKLDGESKGRIEAGGSAKATVEAGQHLVAATTEDGTDQVKQLGEIKAEGQTLVSLELKPARNARLKAEQEAKAPDPNDPASPHASGIYLATGTGAERKMVPLEAHRFATKNIGTIIEVRPGAVADVSASNIKAANAQPEFYFYIDIRGVGFNPVTFGAASSPTDFVLFHFTVNKEGKREAAVAKPVGYGAFRENDRDHISFITSKVGPSVYKVTLPSPLTTGEYGFLSYSINTKNPISKSPSSLFDFGVTGGQ
jgi:hypothetical protein